MDAGVWSRISRAWTALPLGPEPQIRCLDTMGIWPMWFTLCMMASGQLPATGTLWRIEFLPQWQLLLLSTCWHPVPALPRPSNPKSDQKVAHSPSAVDKDGCHLARFYEPFVYMAFAHMCKLQLWQIVLAYVFVGCSLKTGHQNVLEHAYLMRLPFAYLCELNGLETDVLSPLWKNCQIMFT